MRAPSLTPRTWTLLSIALGVMLLAGIALGLLVAPLVGRAPASPSTTTPAGPAAPPTQAAPAASAAPTAHDTPTASAGSTAPAASTPFATPATPDPRRQQLIGVRTARVVEADVSPAIRTVGIVKPDERRQTDINLKLDGWIRELYVDYTGALVRKGQPLVALYSPELLAAQQEYLLARRGRARIEGGASVSAASVSAASASAASPRAGSPSAASPNAASADASSRDAGSRDTGWRDASSDPVSPDAASPNAAAPDAARYAERLVDAARQRLALWDVPAEQMQALDNGEPPRDVTIFRSPVDGIVLDKPIARGMRVTAGQRLYTIVDLSTLWIEADLRESDIGAVSRAMRATVTFDAFPGRDFSGPVTFVSPTMDAEARTVKARIELKNAQRLIKPGMFATVTLTPPARRALVVPADAVLDSGETQTVFVAQGDGRFEPRRIRVGRRLDDLIEVREGLRAGEEVARSATFFLDADSQLRAALDAYAPEATAGQTTPQAATPAPPAPPAPAAPRAAARPEKVPGPAASHPAASQPAAPQPVAPRIVMTYRSDPDPPAGGREHTFTVQLRDAAGEPVADAEVIVTFYMAPMPSMNMPAMRSEFKLPHVGDGRYEGRGTVSMAGSWDVQVVATRNGQRLGALRRAVVAQ